MKWPMPRLEARGASVEYQEKEVLHMMEIKQHVNSFHKFEGPPMMLHLHSVGSRFSS